MYCVWLQICDFYYYLFYLTFNSILEAFSINSNNAEVKKPLYLKYRTISRGIINNFIFVTHNVYVKEVVADIMHYVKQRFSLTYLTLHLPQNPT